MTNITASTMASHRVSVRDARPGDATFICEAFDSAVAYLPSIGSGGQWGSQTTSQRPEGQSLIRAAVDASVVHQRQPQGTLFDLSRSDLVHARVLIAEATSTSDDNSAGGATPVATVIYQDFVPVHLAQNELFEPEAKKIVERGDFVYLYGLFSDFRAGEVRKGAGEAALKRMVEVVKQAGVKIIYVDCWSGNERKLVRYYERQGFKLIKDFLFTKKDGSEWAGSLLSMELV